MLEDADCDNLVPHLDAAFGLNKICQLNLDPIVVAVACFLRGQRPVEEQGVTAKELVEKGSDWFPQRNVHSVKHEAERLARFAQGYPNLFTMNPKTDTIYLKPRALYIGVADSCDEAWYTIVLHRLMKHDPCEVNQALTDIEVRPLSDRRFCAGNSNDRDICYTRRSNEPICWYKTLPATRNR